MKETTKTTFFRSFRKQFCIDKADPHGCFNGQVTVLQWFK